MVIDEYLQPDASFKRLLDEYNKYGSIVVAFDFDNTVNDFHKTGASYNMVIYLLQELKNIKCYLICFTANDDKEGIIKHLNDNNIPYDSINENPHFFKCDERKIYYNVLLDDRAGLSQVYQELNLLVTIIKRQQNEN